MEVFDVNTLNSIYLKEKLRKQLELKLDASSRKRALSDHHAKRKPRPCGLTVHSGIGCVNNCAYCYIQDMGFDFKNTKPYPLGNVEMAYALLNNPWFCPGKTGTFIAIGSVTEPFHPKCVDRSLSYIEAFAEILGNPIQFSTKMMLSEEHVKKLSQIKNLLLSPLITIVTLEASKQLEPNAPTPFDRLEFIKCLRKYGFKPILFLRPIIPGVTDRELDDIVSEAKSAGVYGVVAGSLRVTEGIVARLRKAGVDVSAILKRVGKLQGSKQIAVRSGDLKQLVEKVVKEKGLTYFNSACCACAFSCEIPCFSLCWVTNMCTDCPNRCEEKLPHVGIDDVVRALHLLAGVKAIDVEVSMHKVSLKVSKDDVKKIADAHLFTLQTLLRRKITLIPS